MNKYIYFRDRLKQAATIHDIPQAVKRQLYAKAYILLYKCIPKYCKKKIVLAQIATKCKNFQIFFFICLQLLHLKSCTFFAFQTFCKHQHHSNLPLCVVTILRLIDGSPAGDVPSPFCLTVPLKGKNRAIKIYVFGVIILSFFASLNFSRKFSQRFLKGLVATKINCIDYLFRIPSKEVLWFSKHIDFSNCDKPRK